MENNYCKADCIHYAVKLYYVNLNDPFDVLNSKLIAHGILFRAYNKLIKPAWT